MAGVALLEITERLHREIPLTGVMAATVTAWDGRRVTVSAPLAPNHNHTETAFGGSIAALGILAGYAALHLLLQERGVAAHVLIQKSTMEFVRPIDTDFVAVATLPAETEVKAFLDAVQHKRRGRMTVESTVLSGETVAATHVGIYVAILH
jgi:thioesterase domain-containing protein